MTALDTGLSAPGATRQRILETARRLFSDSGYLGVSMNDIARQLGIKKATLYHHFAGKAAIYSAVLDDVFSGLQRRVRDALQESTDEARLRRLIGSYIGFGLQERGLVNMVVTKLPPEEPVIRERIVRFREDLANQLQPLVERTLAEGHHAQLGEARFLTSMLMWMMDGLLTECSLLDRLVDAERVADHILAVLRPGAPLAKTQPC